MKAIIQAFICSLLITVGQIFWKLAIEKSGGLSISDLNLRRLMVLAFNSYMISGIIVYGIATLYWMYLLGKYEYSYIYPMMAMTYVISILAAYYIFHEHLSLVRVLGVGFVIVGVFFIAKS
jgi:drug/metabolite transporter (DMT)-like permease